MLPIRQVRQAGPSRRFCSSIDHANKRHEPSSYRRWPRLSRPFTRPFSFTTPPGIDSRIVRSVWCIRPLTYLPVLEAIPLAGVVGYSLRTTESLSLRFCCLHVDLRDPFHSSLFPPFSFQNGQRFITAARARQSRIFHNWSILSDASVIYWVGKSRDTEYGTESVVTRDVVILIFFRGNI